METAQGLVDLREVLAPFVGYEVRLDVWTDSLSPDYTLAARVERKGAGCTFVGHAAVGEKPRAGQEVHMELCLSRFPHEALLLYGVFEMGHASEDPSDEISPPSHILGTKNAGRIGAQRGGTLVFTGHEDRRSRRSVRAELSERLSRHIDGRSASIVIDGQESAHLPLEFEDRGEGTWRAGVAARHVTMHSLIRRHLEGVGKLGRTVALVIEPRDEPRPRPLPLDRGAEA